MNQKLLILDDDPGVLKTYQDILGTKTTMAPLRSSRTVVQAAAIPERASSLELAVATTGLEALKLIERATTDGTPFVGGFFDVKLGPGIDGIETIRRALAIDPNLLCCIITAYQDRSIDEISKIFGEAHSDQWDFLSKPFTPLEIEQKSRQLISSWNRRHREAMHLMTIQDQQTQLVLSERLATIGTLSRGIGHELGNILFRIQSTVDLAIAEHSPEKVWLSLSVLTSATERAGVIVKNLQAFVRTEPKRERLYLSVPIQDSLQLIQHELRQTGIHLVQHPAPNLPVQTLNRTEIGQVFLNLFINSLHAMEEGGGSLTVSTREAGDWIVAEVTDTGLGIAPSNLPHIFDPLFTTKGERGTGIGLSVSQKIIHNHGGKIEVKSQLNHGTTFLIHLPKS